MVFDAILSLIDEVSSMNPSPNVFIFGDFSINHKDWFTYFSGTTLNNLTQTVNSPPRIHDCVYHCPALLDLCISSDPSFCSTVVFHPLGDSDHVFSVSIDFLLKSKRDDPFHCTAYDYSLLTGIIFAII